MSDQQAIQDMLASERNVTHPRKQFATSRYHAVPDNNKGIYSGGIVKFNTSGIPPEDLVIWRNSLVEFPLNLVSSTAVAYSSTTRLAVKESIAQMIYGLVIDPINPGSNIVSETQGSTAIMGSIKRLLETNVDFIKQYGPQLHHYGIDRLLQKVADNIETDVGSYPTTTTIMNPLANRSLLNRVTVLESKHSTGTVTTFSFLALIPLKLVHDWFDVMSGPIDNLALRIQFHIANISGNQFQPFCAPVYTAKPLPIEYHRKTADDGIITVTGVVTAVSHGMVAGQEFRLHDLSTDAVFPILAGSPITRTTPLYVVSTGLAADAFNFSLTAPTTAGVHGAVYIPTTASVGCLEIIPYTLPYNNITPASPNMHYALRDGVASFVDRNYSPGACNLWLHIVTLNPEAGKDLLELKTANNGAGTTQTIQYRVTENLSKMLATETTINHTLATEIVSPQRIFVMVPKVTAGISVTEAMDNVFPSWIGRNILYNTNVVINTTASLYKTDIASQYQFYQMLADQMPGRGESTIDGAGISWEDFRNGMNIYCLDMQHYQNTAPNLGVSLKLKSSIGTANADPNIGTITPVSGTYDLICIVERMVTLFLRRSASGVKVLAEEGSNKA